ncbi:MAG: carboxymuconolactone decarboxylase family protein [Methylocella sp.]
MAHSSAALGGYLGLAGALAAGELQPALREQIAVAVAGANSCDYCASAHVMLGAKAGIPRDEIERYLTGVSIDPRTAAALNVVTKIVRERGHLADADLEAIRAAGFSEGEIVELVAHAAMNIFTNYFNHIAGSEIDFPLVRTTRAAAEKAAAPAEA